MPNNWYVITGGPSSGKTSLISQLAKLDYATFPEAARLVIDEELAKGKTLKQIRADELAFQEKVLAKKLAIEADHQANKLTFFDRGLHDSIAYLQYYGWEPKKSDRQAVNKAWYKTVFLLEPLSNFQQDYARTENLDFSLELTELLDKVYTAANLNPIRVPVMPLEERLQFILSHTNGEANV